MCSSSTSREPAPQERALAAAPGAAFHTGEIALQCEAGVAERMARIGPQAFRDHLTEQHRAFFPLLPCVIAAAVDDRGQPLASLLAGPPGFAWSPDPRTLRVDAVPLSGDPLAAQLRPGAPLGLLGIQAHTRRRNRLNGVLSCRDERGFALEVRQSFGNCPKYIHPRRAEYVASERRSEVVLTQGLDLAARKLIESADTFFIASAHPAARDDHHRSQGADVSHRGGLPGFAHFGADGSFSIPDYRGNDFFNTLGNVRLEPRVGLLFIDFFGGDLLQLEASAELLTGSHPAAQLNGTGRIVQFRVSCARLFRNSVPLRFEDVA